MARQGETERPHVTIQQVRQLLGVLLPLPALWVAAIAALMALSIVHVTTGGGRTVVDLQVRTLTAVLAGVVWAPALLRVLAIAGGALKTPAGEAQTGGLLELLRNLPPDTQRRTISGAIAVIDEADPVADPAERRNADQLRAGLEQELASLTPSAAAARRRMEEIARAYEQLRRDLPSGNERTFEMNRLFAEARSLARTASLSFDEIGAKMASTEDGDRIVALAAIQAASATALFDPALAAVGDPRSAFEQYQALRAVDDLFDRLGPQQRARLRAVVEQQTEKWITPDDPSRWLIARRLLDKRTA